ncbi:hypothetical protein EPA93_04895 [Ktedonosporobacter rubrisoli]|uniref:Uncharacterized protein n=1 Tax=Ktedonosporobacter rubrisoli TaxID=2509675 RepID=A0A4P6JK00_KTERU|nr:hypothetical protein EPA93_04895 [Ktedonosporobacter rubrisoli]
MKHRQVFTLLLLLAGILCITSGCQFSQSGFANLADSVGDVFIAANTTISYVQEGKLTPAYARASFVNYRSQLEGVEQQLPTQDGAPDKQKVRRLLALFQPAKQVVERPCLTNSCDWHTQVAILQRAGKAFQEAAEQ